MGYETLPGSVSEHSSKEVQLTWELHPGHGRQHPLAWGPGLNKRRKRAEHGLPLLSPS